MSTIQFTQNSKLKTKLRPQSNQTQMIEKECHTNGNNNNRLGNQALISRDIFMFSDIFAIVLIA